MITMTAVTSQDTATAYNAIMDALMEVGANRTTAVCGLLTVLAVQMRGQMLSTDELTAFVNEGSSWATMYLMPTGVVQ
jgi:hypothetical protein